MTDLTAVIHNLTDVFDRLGLPYAIMGGMPLVKVRPYLDGRSAFHFCAASFTTV